MKTLLNSIELTEPGALERIDQLQEQLRGVQREILQRKAMAVHQKLMQQQTTSMDNNKKTSVAPPQGNFNTKSFPPHYSSVNNKTQSPERGGYADGGGKTVLSVSSGVVISPKQQHSSDSGMTDCEICCQKF